MESAQQFLRDINAEVRKQTEGTTDKTRLTMARLFTEANAKILSGESRLMSVVAFLLNDEVFTAEDGSDVELSATTYSHARAHDDANRLFVLSNTISAIDPLHPLGIRMAQMLRRYHQVLSSKVHHPVD